MEVDHRQAIIDACRQMETLLLEKNDAYGNSALNPVRIFSKASTEEQLAVRMDDKLSRIIRGKNLDKVPEDTKKDLCGYLLLDLANQIIKEQQNT